MNFYSCLTFTCISAFRPRAGEVHGCSAGSCVWKPRGDPDVGDLERSAFPQALRAPGAQAIPARASWDAGRHRCAAAFERRCHWKEVSVTRAGWLSTLNVF